MNKKNTICAVIVTYNRKALLIECIKALKEQTHPINAIYIIDNASTDNTPMELVKFGYLKENPPENLHEAWVSENKLRGQSINIYYMRMHNNSGGAGGFYEGVKNACQKGYDWLWLMDDDTIPTKNALKKLIEVKENKIFKKNTSEIGFLCSRVLWMDNTPHLMNIPAPKVFINNKPYISYYDEKNRAISVESCSFVSVLINSKAVKEIGLPIKEFFIWGDDIEFTRRIIKNNYIGLFVLDSIVYHKTKENYSVNILNDKPENAWKYFYAVRNRIYFDRPNNKLKHIIMIIKNLLLDIKNILKRDKNKMVFLKIILKGYAKGIIFSPKIIKIP